MPRRITPTSPRPGRGGKIDQRRANANWNIYGSKGYQEPWSAATYDSMHLAVLMDIRDQLQRLNATLNCPNALAIPSLLRDIKAALK